MQESNKESVYNAALCKRVRDLRDSKRWTQKQMASALGIPEDRYRKYEVRSPLPAYLFELLAQIMDTDVHFIVTGNRAPTPARPFMRQNFPKRA